MSRNLFFVHLFESIFGNNKYPLETIRLCNPKWLIRCRRQGIFIVYFTEERVFDWWKIWKELAWIDCKTRRSSVIRNWMRMPVWFLCDSLFFRQHGWMANLSITTNSWAVKEFSSKGISTQNKLIFFSFCYCIEELCERWYLLHAKSESQLFVQRKFSKKRGENEHIYKCHPFYLYNESCFASDFSFYFVGKNGYGIAMAILLKYIIVILRLNDDFLVCSRFVKWFIHRITSIWLSANVSVNERGR